MRKTDLQKYIASFSLMAFCLIAPPAAPASPDFLSERIQTLNGQQNFHAGPNCYNAVSYVHGFTEYLYQTSDTELKYYLSQYCKQNMGSPKPGDIHIMGVPDEKFENSFEHAQVVLDGSQIFEKGATTGVYTFEPSSPFYQDNLIYTYYAARKKQDSPYTGFCTQGNPNCRTFTCQQAVVSNNQCASQKPYQVIKSIQKQLQEISFNPQKDVFREASTLLGSIERDLPYLYEMNPADACAVYYFSMWESISWHINYNFPLLSGHDVIAKINNSIRSMRLRILEAQPGPVTEFVVQ